MTSRIFRAALLPVLAVATLGVSIPAAAAETNPWDGNWHYDVAIYGWFPGVNGTFNFDLPASAIISPPAGDTSHSAAVTPNDYLSSLQFAAMLYGEARKGNAAIFGDLMYLDAASLTSKVQRVQAPGGAITLPVNADVNAGLRSTIFTVGGSYTIDRTRLGYFDLLGGFRYAGMRTSLDWNFSGPNGVLSASGGTSDTINLYDGLVGFRGSVLLSPDGKWYLPYYADIGAGNDSNWTWQAYAGIGYKFDWGNVLVAFRNLSYNANKGKPIESLDLTGPLIAFDFRW